MNNLPDDPTRDPQHTEAWRALSQLLSAADVETFDAGLRDAGVSDLAMLAAKIARRIENRARRRQFRIGLGAAAGALAAAASLAIVAWFVTIEPQKDQFAAVAPAVAPAASQPAPEGSNIPPAQESPQVVVGNEAIEIAPWNDELDDATLALAVEIRTVEQRWRQSPDSISALESQIDQLEQELRNSPL